MRYTDETKLSELKVKDLKEIIHNELNKREYKVENHYLPMYQYVPPNLANSTIICKAKEYLRQKVEEMQCKKET